MNNRVALVCDGSVNVGYGHIRRTLTLAETLRQYGMAVQVSGLSSEANSLIPLRFCEDVRAQVIVFDVPSNIDDKIHTVKESGKRVISLDYFGGEEPDVAIAIYPHKPVRARLASYVGLEYQMIRAEIVSQPRNSHGSGVVVVLGGGDILQQGWEVAQRLTHIGEQVTLIQGPLSKHEKRASEFIVISNPPNMPNLLASSAWMVTNGGGCMFEAMFLGKAAIAIPQTKAEKVLAEYCLERGALLGIGLDQLRYYSPDEITRVGHSASKLIDGKGAHRVADIIRGFQ